MKKFMIKLKVHLKDAYKQIKIGDPLNSENHVGPLIDKDAVKNYLDALNMIEEQGGSFLVSGGVLTGQRI